MARKAGSDALSAEYFDTLDVDSLAVELCGVERRRALVSPSAELPRKPRARGSAQRGVVRTRGKLWRLEYRDEAGENGRRKQRSVPIAPVAEMSYEQAREAADAMIDRLAPRKVAPGSTCSWGEWCDRYLSVYVPALRETSRPIIESVVRRHLRRAFAGLAVHEIRTARIQTWLARMSARGAAPQTIEMRYRVLRRMLGRARAEGLAVELPAKGDIDLPRDDRVTETVARAFTATELDAILARAKEPWHTLIMLCAFTGLRIGEALALQWSDIDFDAARIEIRRQAVNGRTTAPKTAASVASLHVPPRLLQHLRAFSASASPKSDACRLLLFPSPRGGVYHTSGVRRHHLKPLLDELGLNAKGRAFHAFRHWLGTSAARSGVPLPVLQRMLRHRDPRSTQRYVAITDTEADAALAALEARHGAGSPPCEVEVLPGLIAAGSNPAKTV